MQSLHPYRRRMVAAIQRKRPGKIGARSLDVARSNAQGPALRIRFIMLLVELDDCRIGCNRLLRLSQQGIYAALVEQGGPVSGVPAQRLVKVGQRLRIIPQRTVDPAAAPLPERLLGHQAHDCLAVGQRVGRSAPIQTCIGPQQIGGHQILVRLERAAGVLEAGIEPAETAIGLRAHEEERGIAALLRQRLVNELQGTGELAAAQQILNPVAKLLGHGGLRRSRLRCTRNARRLG